MDDSKTNEQYLTFLRNHPVMSIAAVLDNKPISSVVLFTVTDDFVFSFVTGKDSYKAKALQQNPQISFSIWQPKELLIQSTGKVSEIEDSQDIDEILDFLVEASQKLYDMWPPLLQLQPDEYAFFKVKPTWMRAMNLSSQSLVNQSLFDEIELPSKG